MANPSSTAAQAGDWLTSSFSTGSSMCVEVRFRGSEVDVRDSKYRRDPSNNPSTEPVITVTATEWLSFVDQLTSGTRISGPLQVTRSASGTTLSHVSGTSLRYTPAEWRAFRNGIAAGELRAAPAAA